MGTATWSRRDFLKAGAAGGGLLLAVQFPWRSRAFAQPGSPAALAPSAFLEVGSDDSVTVWITKSEMGQGVRTSLAMILADELEADWTRIQIRQADYDPKYGDQGTGGSTSVATLWEPLRKAGAQAREMLVAAAAQRWGVGAESLRAEQGTVVLAEGGRRATYGDLAAAAGTLPVPESPRLKDAKDFRLIGRSLRRLDAPSKVDGSARFGLDVVVPGMKYATIARCPVFGGTMKGYDAEKARAVPGVTQVVEVPNGVAVIAENTWAALEGRRALECHWDEGSAAQWDSAKLSRMMQDRSRMGGAIARNDGDAPGELARTSARLEAEYEVPFLAHATMEPMNCTAHVQGNRCEVWAPTQGPNWNHGTIAEALKIPPENIVVHVTLMGGGFGRRANSDFVLDAVEASKASGVPVKLVWSREDDIQRGWYRPLSFHRLAGAIDGRGRPTAWSHRVVTPSIVAQYNPRAVAGDLDEEAVDGASNLPYAIPNLRVECCLMQTPVPVWYWRSVYASQNAFANESFIDELAHAAGRDPFEFRRGLLTDKPRHRAVLELAAAKAGWGSPLPAGRGRGIALHHFFSDAIVAEVAEVSVSPKGEVRVHRVVCALDCGTVINPDGVAAQIESAVVYGLGAALKGAITLKEGRTEQSNFHDYPVLRMNEMPIVETHLVASTEPPMGVGEPGTPPIAPAVANAVFAATGKRIRRLPIKLA